MKGRERTIFGREGIETREFDARHSILGKVYSGED